MADIDERELVGEDEYDEDADSDFEADASAVEDASSASDDDGAIASSAATQRPRKRQKIDNSRPDLTTELDSGDEATISALKKSHKRDKIREGEATGDVENESDGWRARTRAMRTKEKEDRKKNKLASSKGSTIDVNKIWEEMNKPAPLNPPSQTQNDTADPGSRPKAADDSKSLNPVSGDSEKENMPVTAAEETITIKRTFKFAGEVHVEEKTVLKSSAEAQLWLSQQQSSKGTASEPNGAAMNRPMRKVSRFDPNYSNLDVFKGSWATANAQEAKFKGPKLNVVEKSKMDWAEHVDTEGLKEELDTHAKAKEGYLTRMDFLREVDERREAEARAARLKGR